MKESKGLKALLDEYRDSLTQTLFDRHETECGVRYYQPCNCRVETRQVAARSALGEYMMSEREENPHMRAMRRHLQQTRRPLPLKTVRLAACLVGIVLVGGLMYEHGVGPGWLIATAFIAGVIAERIG
jgi:hypothetical protein